MHTRTISGFAAITLLLTGVAGAEEPAGPAGRTTLLDRLVVTPLRRDSSLARSTSSVTVVEAEEIQRSSAPDLPALLRSLPGITVTTGGGIGSVTSVGLRGASGAQTLILIDGVNVKSATLGTTSVQNIPLSSIERIEIARGTHSAQYGADAIGGVINIITRKGACPEGKDVCATVGTGALYPWGGYGDAAIHGETAGGTRFYLGGRLLGTRGYNFTLPGNPSFEDDDDGFLIGSLNLSADRDFAWGQGSASAFYARSRGAFDRAPNAFETAPANEADTDTLAARLGARIDHDPDWTSRVEVTLGYDGQDNFRRGTDTHDRYATLRYGLFASTTRSFDLAGMQHAFTFGGEASREEIEATTKYDATARNLGAVFAQHSIEWGALTLDGGLRYDHNQSFGAVTTFNLGASYEIVPGLRARASYGTGFRAPTFNDLYWPFDGWTSGNPDLKPEHSRGYEIGLSWQPTEATVLDLAFYQSWVRDMINWQMDSTTFVSMPVNIDSVTITGFEASLSHRFNERWHGRAWLDMRAPRDQDGSYVLRQERLKLGAEVGYRPIDNLELTLGVLHVGPRADTELVNFTRTELPSYTLVDFGALYSFDATSRLKFSVSNVFDARYSTNWGYKAPGRSFELSYTRTF